MTVIDTTETVQELGVHVRTVGRWVRAGKMPKRTKRGRQKDFYRADIKAMVAAKSRGGQP